MVLALALAGGATVAGLRWLAVVGQTAAVRAQFDAFLSRHPRFAAQPVAVPLGAPRGQGTRLTPYRDGTDGFFIACATFA